MVEISKMGALMSINVEDDYIVDSSRRYHITGIAFFMLLTL